MNIKIYKSQDSEIVVLCDKDLIGKRFEEGEIVLDIDTKYYSGQDTPEEEVSRILHDAINITIVGEKSIDFALSLKIIRKEDIKYIKNIPFSICVG